MISSVMLLWFLSAMLGEGFSLDCFHCNITGVNQCPGTSKTCSSGQDSCISTYTESTVASVKKVFIKSCGVTKDCEQTFSMTAPTTQQMSVTACCKTNQCIPVIPTLPSKNTTSNGVSCPACYEQTENCKAKTNTDCTGAENKCISYTATVKTGTTNVTYSVKGCATERMCTLGEQAILPGAPVTVKMFQCSHAPSLLPSMLFPAVSGLLFLKLHS
ncbi:phospholipase A2 inhibitor and Ly6/PLAUR domain-containing protein-like [Ascaphus truei]|uniref:phospholipase A2 inhibitor and Ly6/PLAUR domain-containing protein-like n=1 Tax=Ascaphus truei TaxID=8439 RepID=UPI003F5992D4